MKTSTSLQMRKVLDIVLIWGIVGIFLTVYDHFLMRSDISNGPVENYSFWGSLIFNVFAGLLGGFLGGITLTEINKRYRTKPYYQGLIVAAVFFVLIVALITLITSIFSVFFNYTEPFSDPLARTHFWERLLSTVHFKNALFWWFVVILTQFSIQISDKFGPKNLLRMITGKYHFPIKENRVFMFLDLKSSTSIAEKLGEEDYHEFLKEVFRDITNPILNSRAEIYQYVGDEVVISWNMQRILDVQQVLDCFYQIKNLLESKKSQYQNRYNAFPEFKAGAHCGQVIAGEIGIIKREITYSGDVLNTTARIQAQCNSLESSLLISDQLRQLNKVQDNPYPTKSKGFISLKGKGKQLELFAVEKTS